MRRCLTCGRVYLNGQWVYFTSQVISHIYHNLDGNVDFEDGDCEQCIKKITSATA